MRLLRPLLQSSVVQSVVGWLAMLYIRLVFSTSRWQWVGLEEADRMLATGKPVIVCFWHGRLLMMCCAQRGGYTYPIMISGHRDGRLIARTVRYFGIPTIVGSSSAQAVSATKQCMLWLKRPRTAVCITPDGPRGPRAHASVGVVEIARLAGVPIYPVSYGVSRRKVLRSWDRFVVPLPFSRGAFVTGSPLQIDRDAGPAEIEAARKLLEDRLNAATTTADRLVGIAATPPVSAC